MPFVVWNEPSGIKLPLYVHNCSSSTVLTQVHRYTDISMHLLRCIDLPTALHKYLLKYILHWRCLLRSQGWSSDYPKSIWFHLLIIFYVMLIRKVCRISVYIRVCIKLRSFVLKTLRTTSQSDQSICTLLSNLSGLKL